VSMGDVAASGGYWISMASDEVIADRATVTGSIGVFTIFPTAEKVIDKLGIHTAGVTTTWLADADNPLRPLDPRFGQLVQASVNHIYDDFTAKAAQARRTTQARIDEVGQGRVWTGAQARERGLIDRLGSYDDALRAAAKRARLGDDFRVAYTERPNTLAERLLERLGVSDTLALTVQVKLGLLPATLLNGGLSGRATAGITRDLGWLAAAFPAASHVKRGKNAICRTPQVLSCGVRACARSVRYETIFLR
jgi:protease-4